MDAFDGLRRFAESSGVIFTLSTEHSIFGSLLFIIKLLTALSKYLSMHFSSITNFASKFIFHQKNLNVVGNVEDTKKPCPICISTALLSTENASIIRKAVGRHYPFSFCAIRAQYSNFFAVVRGEVLLLVFFLQINHIYLVNYKEYFIAVSIQMFDKQQYMIFK